MNANTRFPALSDSNGPNFANSFCPPDWARLAWDLIRQGGFSDKEIEEKACVNSSVLSEPFITYRDWVNILWAGREFLGEEFPYLIAKPLQLHHLGIMGSAVAYAPTPRAAWTRLSDWAMHHEPINTFIRISKPGVSNTRIETEYPLSGWTRTCFTISSAKLGLLVLKAVTNREESAFKVSVNCEKPKSVTRHLTEQLFPGGIEWDYSQDAAWRIEIPNSLADMPNPLAEATRYEFLLRGFNASYAPTEISIVKQVEAMQYTTRHLLSADQVADRLHISRKVLERRLSDAGTTAKKIADEIGYERYCEMRDAGYTKSEITRKLGFVDSRALTRLMNIFEK